MSLPHATPARSLPHGAAAALVALIAIWVILDFAQAILMPFVLALFTAVLIQPVQRALEKRRVPHVVAIVLAQVVGFLPIVVFLAVFVLTVGPVMSRLPWYQQTLYAELSHGWDKTLDFLDERNLLRFMVSERDLPPAVITADPTATDPTPVAPPPSRKEVLRQSVNSRILPQVLAQSASFLQSLAGTTTALLVNLFLVVLFTTFILVEGARFAEKSREAFGIDNPILLSLERIAHDVRTYLVAKTLISLLTGLVVWIFLTVMAVDFAGFWGLAAFALNYIPNIGSVAASIPPVLIAILNAMLDPSGGWLEPTLVIVGLFLIQTIIGTFMDPRLVGNSLQLSPLVILLSMMVWGLLWGPVGMILSVPIMVSIKIICSHVEGLAPLATLMKA